MINFGKKLTRIERASTTHFNVKSKHSRIIACPVVVFWITETPPLLPLNLNLLFISIHL